MEMDGFDHNNLVGQPSPIYDAERDHKEVNEYIEISKIYLVVVIDATERMAYKTKTKPLLN